MCTAWNMFKLTCDVLILPIGTVRGIFAWYVGIAVFTIQAYHCFLHLHTQYESRSIVWMYKQQCIVIYGILRSKLRCDIQSMPCNVKALPRAVINKTLDVHVIGCRKRVDREHPPGKMSTPGSSIRKTSVNWRQPAASAASWRLHPAIATCTFMFAAGCHIWRHKLSSVSDTSLPMDIVHREYASSPTIMSRLHLPDNLIHVVSI